jgi:predicted nucleotidyltransferase
MTARLRVRFPEKPVADFCRRHRVIGLWVFGSALRDDFRPDSDVDVLVQFEPDARPTLSEFIAIENELGEMVHRKVDVVDRKSVEHSPNYIRREAILNSLEPLHVPG